MTTVGGWFRYRGIWSLYSPHKSKELVQKQTERGGVGLSSASVQILQWQLTWICHYTRQNTGGANSLRHGSLANPFIPFQFQFNQKSMHHYPMIHSMMQRHICWDWLITVFNMHIILTCTHAPSLIFPLPPSWNAWALILSHKTLAADNKTNWFHKSPKEQISCYELWQHDFSKIQHEEFRTARLFYQVIYLIRRPVKKQLPNNRLIKH